MNVRLSKSVLVAAVALFYTLVSFDNLVDYGSNFEFVHHVIAMDTTFPGNHAMSRAFTARRADTVFYTIIITWELLSAVLSWLASIRLFRTRHLSLEFARARSFATGSLTVGLLLWFSAFLTIGGEWFLMWQSKSWNGQDAAVRIFTCIGIILLIVMMPEEQL